MEPLPDNGIDDAMNKINAILDVHDLAGYIILNAPEKVKFRCKMDATWNSLTFDNDTGEMRLKTIGIRCKKKKKRSLELSIGVIMALVKNMSNHGHALNSFLMSLSKRFDIKQVLSDFKKENPEENQ